MNLHYGCGLAQATGWHNRPLSRWVVFLLTPHILAAVSAGKSWAKQHNTARKSRSKTRARRKYLFRIVSPSVSAGSHPLNQERP